MTAIFAFLKGKLFSQGGLLIALLIGFILLFIIPNSDTILSKFGFETKTTLKGQVVSLTKDLGTAVDNNESLVSSGKIAEENHASAVTTLTNNFEQKESDRKKVDKINKKADKVITPAITSLKMTEVITPTTITLDKLKVDEVSKANISALNETFNELFQDEQVKS